MSDVLSGPLSTEGSLRSGRRNREEEPARDECRKDGPPPVVYVVGGVCCTPARLKDPVEVSSGAGGPQYPMRQCGVCGFASPTCEIIVCTGIRSLMDTEVCHVS